MSTTFEVGAGDTFASIARKQYGSEQHAKLVEQANPGLSEPLPVGAVITTPPVAGAPVDLVALGAANDEDEVALLVDGKRFRFWTDISITLALDAMASVDFNAPFEPEDPEFRETFRPFSFKPVVVTLDGEPLFTGTMLTPTPALTPDGTAVAVSCYSRPGVLDDCTPPAGAFPLEFNGQSLPAIAGQLCAPFGIAVEFASEPGPAFERVALDPSSSVLPFLADLAKQRSRVMTSSPAGGLEFPNVTPVGSPVAYLREGESPLVSVTPQFAPQDYYSHVTGLESVTLGADGSQFTVKNVHLIGVVRPLTFKGPDVEGGDIKTATQAKSGRMFGNMVTYSLVLSTWRDPQGAHWRPNTTLVLHAPSAMVYQPYEFLVRQVVLTKNGDSRVAELEIVLPGSFTGETPETLPWAG